ncbi:MAG TPA: hypothetical protein VHZ95_14135, partial [Polyangiales bacterium]|nr:hypothetical protein [Polyangiales bacterium]
GRRLKEYQRNAVRELGGEVIYWTYDPLVARNAHLNFNRLGARVAEYVEDMYGITDSVLHGGIPTDRFVVAWPTRDDEIDEHLAESGRVLASSDCRDAPIVNADWIDGAVGASILPHCLRVEVPGDGEALLVSSSDDARRWRHSVRQSLQWCLRAGYSVVAFDIDEQSAHGYYLMTKTTRAPSPGLRL